MDQRSKIQVRLLRWYRKHRRDLPWRQTTDPYAILVSEIMLQQTQVERVVPKYQAFLKRFPSLRALARSQQADVIRAWAGLGYNRRARYLHQLARVVIMHQRGALPQSPQALQALPGIGPYTAAAVACFAFGAPVALVDVNVRRVLGRLEKGVRGPATLGTKALWLLAAQYVPKKSSVTWNSALMDFGATVCTARKPHCESCPLQTQCRAYPAILGTPMIAKPTKAFVDSTRYWRGKIVSFLRKQTSTPRTMQRMFALQGLPAARLQALLHDLQQEALVHFVRGRYTL